MIQNQKKVCYIVINNIFLKLQVFLFHKKPEQKHILVVKNYRVTT